MKALLLSPLLFVGLIPSVSTYEKPHDNYYFCSHLEEYLLGQDADNIISYCAQI